MSTRMIEIERLRPHPLNSNIMGRDRLVTLRRHIEQTGRYPPLIVRPHEDAYQILDGRHRARVLAAMGMTEAQCIVWAATDREAMLLLATLNRLEGSDEPRARARLLSALMDTTGGPEEIDSLLRLLPESRSKWKAILKHLDPPPTPVTPRAVKELPSAVHFFLCAADRRQLEKTLRTIGGRREAALMRLVDAYSRDTVTQPADGEH